MLHILFPVQNIFFGIESQLLFGIPINYMFGHNESYTILVIAVMVVICILLTRLIQTPIRLNEYRYMTSYSRGLLVYYFFSYLVVTSIWFLILKHGFNYGLMAIDRSNYSIFIEMRIFAYLGYLFLVFNFPIQANSKFFKFTSLLFFVTVVLFQARSILAELFFIIGSVYLIQSKDRFSFVKFALILPVFFIPNLFIFIRQGSSLFENFGELFQFEYLILINNIMAASITYEDISSNTDFFKQLFLIIPSPIRSLLEIEATNNNFYEDIAAIGNVTSGGFSLLGQLYIYFNYFFIIPIGILLLKLRYYYLHFFHVSPRVNFHQIAFPILLAIFILGLRNDFGVVLKQIIQLLIVCSFLNYYLRIKLR